MRKNFVLILILAGICFAAVVPPVLFKPKMLQLPQPEGWPQAKDIFKNNPLTEEGFQLGRKLFYDGQLSKDGKFACASCHQQFAAFATFDHDLSHGFNDQFTTRNAPAIQNMAWTPLYHWDGSISELELQPLKPLTASNEMAETIESVISKLKKDKSYTPLFVKAFGDKEITEDRMLKALAQFTGSMVSSDSKYDRVKKGEETFNSAELHGYQIFQSKCESCHKEPLFTDNSFRNNGLAVDNYLKDSGRMLVTKNAADYLKFRVPSLRNVGVTQPYMHDGRFYSLESVVDHYTSAIHDSPTLDPLLKSKLEFTRREKYDLVRFLYTLTDSSFLKNERFSAPQKQ